jgi:hypothetical protein
MNFFEMTDVEILGAITPIMDNMMEGSTEIDHAKHTHDFTDRMKAIVTPEHLEFVCKDYQSKWGTFRKRECVAIFRRKESVAVVWKQFCSKTNDEYVTEAVFIENYGRILIDHAMVF